MPAERVDHPRNCTGCGAKLIWITNENGKPIPLDARNHPIYQSIERRDGDVEWRRVQGAKITHFATCPKAAEFSRSSKQ